MQKRNRKILLGIAIIFSLVLIVLYANPQSTFNQSFENNTDVQEYLDERGLIEEDTNIKNILYGVMGFTILGMIYWTSMGVEK